MDTRILTGGGAPDRYEGRPFLRLLECYMLLAIGELPAVHAELLQEMTPKLQSTYGLADEWPRIVERLMEFSTVLPTELRSMWDRNCVAAADSAIEIDPESWARQVVDTNFV